MQSPLPQERAFSLQVHQLTKLFHLAAAYRHLKIQIFQTQNVGVVKPRFDLADLI